MPAWEHPNGGGGGARFLDVPSVAGEPRVRWSARVPAEHHPWEWGGVSKPRAMLLAASSGVVTRCVDGGTSRFVVLDVDAGKLRLESPAAQSEMPLAIAGEVLLLGASNAVVGRDLGSGEICWTVEDGYASLAAHADGLLVIATVSAISGFRLGGVPERLWRVDAPAPEGALGVAVLSRSLVALTTDRYHRVVFLDGRTGAVVPFGSEVVDPSTGRPWSMPGQFWLGDERGFVGWQRQHGMEAAYYSHLTYRYTLPNVPMLAAPVALTPDLVLARADRKTRNLQCIERATGRVRGSFALGDDALVAAVQDGLYAALGGRAVSFVTYEGALRWRRTLAEPGDEIVALAPLAHRLYALTNRGSVFCLEA